MTTRPLFFVVDQEGIEPSSKRGNHVLSTRLSPLKVFVKPHWQEPP